MEFNRLVSDVVPETHTGQWSWLIGSGGKELEARPMRTCRQVLPDGRVVTACAAYPSPRRSRQQQQQARPVPGSVHESSPGAWVGSHHGPGAAPGIWMSVFIGDTRVTSGPLRMPS